MNRQKYKLIFIVLAALAWFVFIYNWYEFYVNRLLESTRVSNWNSVLYSMLPAAGACGIIFIVLLFFLGKKQETGLWRGQYLLLGSLFLLLSASWIMILQDSDWIPLAVLAFNMVGVFIAVSIVKK